MATIPRFDIHASMIKPGPWVVLPINPSSDGHSSRWRPPPYKAVSNDSYRVKLGSLWAEHKGIATPGKRGRCMFEPVSPCPLGSIQTFSSLYRQILSRLFLSLLFLTPSSERTYSLCQNGPLLMQILMDEISDAPVASDRK